MNVNLETVDWEITLDRGALQGDVSQHHYRFVGIYTDDGKCIPSQRNLVERCGTRVHSNVNN